MPSSNRSAYACELSISSATRGTLISCSWCVASRPAEVHQQAAHQRGSRCGVVTIDAVDVLADETGAEVLAAVDHHRPAVLLNRLQVRFVAAGRQARPREAAV